MMWLDALPFLLESDFSVYFKLNEIHVDKNIAMVQVKLLEKTSSLTSIAVSYIQCEFLM